MAEEQSAHHYASIGAAGDLELWVTMPYGKDFIWCENNLVRAPNSLLPRFSLPYSTGSQWAWARMETRT
jgi:hypothetical protein